MKKLLLILLVLSMLLTVLAACGTKPDPADDDAPGEESFTDDDTGTKAPEEYVLPERDYDGRDFTILMPPGKTWQVEEHQVNPEALNEALFQRNTQLEFAYDVVITPIYKGNNAEEWNRLIHTEANAQTGAYDIVYYPLSYGMIGYISQSRYFESLLDVDYLDLSQDWWLKDWNEILTMNEKLYGVSGYGVVEAMSGAIEVYFNKNIYNEIYPDSDYSELYTLVTAGDWTIDEMVKMAKDATKDLNGDGVIGDDDRYGIVTNSIAYALLYALGSEYITPSETEGYVLNFNDEHNVDVFQKLFYICREDYYRYETSDWLAPNQVFGDGRSLFQISAFDQAWRIMQTGVEYGILPLPKYDTDQENYRTVNNAIGCFAIFTCCDDLEFSAIMLNAWNYYSYKVVCPQYKDSFYKYQVGKESRDSEMIDLIFANMVPEFAHAYGVSFGSVANKIYSLIMNKDTGYTSFYKTNQETWQSQLDIILGKKDAAPSPFD